MSTELQTKSKSLTLAWPGGETHQLFVLAYISFSFPSCLLVPLLRSTDTNPERS